MIRGGYTKDNRPSRPDRSNLGLNPEACRSIWVKAQLLRMGANGQSHIHTVYDWLARLSDLRRAVEQTDKAVQRLAALPDLTTTPGEPIPAP